MMKNFLGNYQFCLQIVIVDYGIKTDQDFQNNQYAWIAKLCNNSLAHL